MPTRVLVTGAGGFIGGHLITYLKEKGYWARGVDIKHHEYNPTHSDILEILKFHHGSVQAYTATTTGIPTAV